MNIVILLAYKKRFKHFPLLKLMLAIGIAALGNQTIAQNNNYQLKQLDIIDHRGFEKPMVAKRIAALNDWQVQGGINYHLNHTGCGVLPSHDSWAAMSQDGLSGISQLPQEKWQGSMPSMQELMGFPGMPAFQQPGGCANVTNVSPQQIVQDYLSRHKRGLNQLAFRVNEQKTQELNAVLNQTMQEVPGMQVSYAGTVADVLLGGHVNGVAFRELARFILFQARTDMVMPMINGPVQISNFNHMMLSATVVRMPNGKLDFNLVENLMAQIVDNPNYTARVNKVRQKMNADNIATRQNIAQINAKGAAERSRMMSESQASLNKTYSEISDIVSSTVTGSSERIIRETSEATLGFETYDDPINGGTIQIDNPSENVWQTDNGNIIMTDNPNLDPNVELELNARRLNATQ